MSDPRITEQAENDLDDAWDYLARRNEAAATGFSTRSSTKPAFTRDFP